MTCIITGLNLIHHGEVVHGDLHLIGGAYVFNACLVEGEAAWEHSEHDFQQGDRFIDASECADYFERRGVICFSAEGAAFNDAAVEYLRG